MRFPGSRPRPIALACVLAVAAAGAGALTPPPADLPRYAVEFDATAIDAAGAWVVHHTFDGFYRRAPGETAWHRVLATPTGAHAALFDGGRAGMFARLDDGRDPLEEPAWRSTDGGRTWSAIPGHRWVARIGPDGLLACDARALARSDDGGSRWRKLPTPAGGCDYTTVVDSTICLTAGLGNPRLERSTDAGEHWTTPRLPALHGQVQVGPGGSLYIQEDRNPGHPLRSDDGGRSWRAEDLGSAGSTVFPDFVSPQLMIVRKIPKGGQWADLRVCMRDAQQTWPCRPRPANAVFAGRLAAGALHDVFDDERPGGGIAFAARTPVAGGEFGATQRIDFTGLPDGYTGRPIPAGRARRMASPEAAASAGF